MGMTDNFDELRQEAENATYDSDNHVNYWAGKCVALIDELTSVVEECARMRQDKEEAE